MSVEDRNVYETTDEVTLVDLMYAIRELQKYVLQIAASVSPVSLEAVSSSTAIDVSALSNSVSVLEAIVANQMPVYYSGYGPPAAGLGKNLDGYWDLAPAEENGQIGYKKIGDAWRQEL